MQVDKVGDRFDPVLMLGRRLLPQVDFSLNSARPPVGVLAEREAGAEVVAFAANLDTSLTGGQLVDGCHGSPICCARYLHSERYKMRKLADTASFKR